MKTKSLFLGLGMFFLFSAQARADHSSRSAADTALLDGYHAVQTALAKDDFDVAKTSSKNLIKTAQDWITLAGEQNPQTPNVKKVLEGSEKVATASEAKEYRVSFGTLSEGLVEFIRKDSNLQSDWKLYYCPMAPSYKYWVQPKSETKKMNPYMGTSMQQCGSTKPWARGADDEPLS